MAGARVRVATTSRRAVCTRRWLESERRSRRAEANGEADACRVATEIYVAESRTQHAPRRSYIDDACFGARARGRRTEANGGPPQRARGQREDKYTLSRSWRSTLKRPCFQDRCADEKFEVAGKTAARRQLTIADLAIVTRFHNGARAELAICAMTFAELTICGQSDMDG